MKTRTWILLFSALAVLCLALCVVFLLAPKSKTAVVYTNGKPVMQIDLTKDGEYRIESGDEWNVLTVKGGKIEVSSTSCASQDCVNCGAKNSGAPLVCLPNRMVIEFSDTEDLDALAH